MVIAALCAWDEMSVYLLVNHPKTAKSRARIIAGSDYLTPTLKHSVGRIFKRMKKQTMFSKF